MMLDEAMRIAEQYGDSNSKHPWLVALNELRAYIEVSQKCEDAALQADCELLTDEQLVEYGAQCQMLFKADEDTISVAEYLKCRLDDAIELISALQNGGVKS